MQHSVSAGESPEICQPGVGWGQRVVREPIA
jgi:hypothetical protein